MLLSYNWLKELINLDQTPEELDNILTMLGIEVEGIIDYKKKYDRFYIAEVLTCEKHPDADKLTICTVNFGKETASVVCGAPNVAVGQKVVLGLEGAVVPNGEFTLSKRMIRGVESRGMICSQVELETGDDAGGIWVLPDDVTPGLELNEYLGMDDIIFDVSLTPNKQDCLSHFGVARDLAAYLRTQPKMPDTKLQEAGKETKNSIEIEILDAEKCPRYTGRVIRGAKISESPDWLKQKLVKIGLRPRNVVVDITNYVMMELGQPLHAFDLDKIQGNKIIVKTAEDGEKFNTLDGKEHILDDNMLMICDAERPVAIGGVMGGQNSEISLDTTSILIESAFFDTSSVRRTSKKLGIQSDSSYRFERGVDYEMVSVANNRAAKLIADLTGGTIENGIVDCVAKQFESHEVEVRYDRVKKVLGINISNDDIKDILTSLSFKSVDETSDGLKLIVPSYRVDVTMEVDLIEEVARIYNYDNIESQLEANINFGGATVPNYLSLPPIRQEIRDFMVSRGYFEIMTQNMLDPASVKIYTDDPVEISNPLGEELSLMRPSIVPSVLKVINRNIRLGNHDLRLYEIGKTFQKSDDKDNFVQGIKERQELLIAITGKEYPKQWGRQARNVDFYDIRGIFEELAATLKLNRIKLKAANGANESFNKNSISVLLGKTEIGRIGQINNELATKFDIEVPVFMAVIDLTPIYTSEKVVPKYTPVPPFPGVVRDLGFIVDSSTPAEQVRQEIIQKGGKLLQDVLIFDLYEGKNIGEGKKSLAFSLSYSAPDRTLVDSEVDESVNLIIISIEKKFKAILRK